MAIRDRTLWLWLPLSLLPVCCASSKQLRSCLEATTSACCQISTLLSPPGHGCKSTGKWQPSFYSLQSMTLFCLGLLLSSPVIYLWQTVSPHNKEIKHGALRRAALGGTNKQQWLEFSGASFMASFTHSALLQFLCDWLYYYLCFKEDAEAWRSQTTCLVTP